MYKVIIADDEDAVRERLISLFKKLPNDFEIIGTYSNGYDALTSGIPLEPDLLITDIKMPYISGIELIKAAKVELPLIQSIIISGYDSFDFAKQAISLGVISYISKPITQEELEQALLNVKKELDNKLKVNKNIENLQEQVQSSQKILQEYDLTRLVTMKEIPTNFKRKLLEDGVDISFKNQFIVIFDYDEEVDNIPFEQIDLSRIYLDKFINEEFDHSVFHSFNLEEKLCVLFTSKEEYNKEKVISHLSAILAKTLKSTEVSISCGVSDLGVYPEINYRKMYRHAKRSLEYRTVVGSNLVLAFDDVEKGPIHQTCKIDENEYKAIAYDISYGIKDDAKEKIKSLIETISKPEYKDSYSFILSSVLDTVLKSCVSLTTFYQNNISHIELTNNMFACKSVESLINFFDKLVDDLEKVNKTSRLSGIELSFMQIKQFVESNYTKSTLSLDDVADELNYSVSYISAILKKNNTSFTKYLTEARMEKARVLLADPNNKLLNISSQVGYSDPYYFSHCFKKYFGVSPIEYRKK